MLTDIQLLIITTIIGLFVSWLTARQTASSESVKSLSIALASLRAEFEAVKKEYEAERKESAELRVAYEKEASLNAIFKKYISQLVLILSENKIEFPKLDEP